MNTEILRLRELITLNLNYAKLLNNQPTVDRKLVNDYLWRALELTLELDGLYAQQIREIDAREVVTIKEELEKRQRMVELSNSREEILGDIFDRNDPDQRDLADLFADMRNQVSYERVFYESDVKLVQQQLDERRKADEVVADLRVERQSVENEMAAIISYAVDFETFNARLNEEYEKFIQENHINEITNEEVVTLVKERSSILEKQMLIDRIRSLAKTATNITEEDYKYVNFISEPEMELQEINEKLFLYDLGILLKQEVHSYEELLEKTNRIHEFAAEREYASAHIYDISRPNPISYRTLSFALDVQNVQKQINAPKRLAELEEKLKEIDAKIETAYDNVKGRKELDDIINNRKPEYQIEEIKPIQSETIAPLLEETKEETIKENNEEKALVLSGEKALVQLNPDQYRVTKVEKAKKTLLEKIRNIKNRLVKIAIPVILAGTLLGYATIGGGKNPENEPQPSETITIEQPIDFDPSISDIEIEEIIDKTVEDIEKQYSITVGDQVNISNGVQYYRNSQAAQLEQNSYVTGKSGLKEGNYFVNRIALLAKDANGLPTGQVIDVNVTPGVSAEEVARSLGLAEGSYDVIMHIASGDREGNFIEATKGVPSLDDLCWIKTDGTYSNGLSLANPAAKVLDNSAERGMAR